MEKRKLIGFSSAMMSTLLLGTVGIFVRNISSNGYIITFARVGLGFVFLTLFLFFKNEMKNIKRTDFSFSLLVTGVLLALTSICYINAINSGSLANAVFLLYLGPLGAVGISAVVLKEKFTFLNAGLLFLAFLGFLFLLEFKFSLNFSGSQLWGVGSAVCCALYIVFNRHIPQSTPVLTRSFYQLCVGTLTILPFLNAEIFSIPMADVPWLLAIGFLQGFLAFSLIILSLKYLKAIEYGTISYIEPLFAALIGFTLYAEGLTRFQFIGCSIIFLGGMIQVIMHDRQVKK